MLSFSFPLLSQSSLSRKVAFNTLVQVGAKVITVSFTLLTTILLTSYLGKEKFGGYMYLFTLMVMFGSLADWGTVIIGVREAAKEKEKQGQVLGNIILLRLLLSFLAAGLLLLFAFFGPLKVMAPLKATLPFFYQPAVLLAALILVFNSLKASFGIIFQTKLKMEKLAIADVLIGFLILLFTWLVIQQNGSLFWLIAVFGLAILVGVILAGYFAFKTVRLVFHFDRQFMGKLIKEALPMGAILLLFTVDNKIDTVMLGILKDSGAVAIYGLAYRVYDVLILGAAYLMNVLLPIFSRYSSQSMKLKRLFQKAFDVLFLMGLAVVLLIWGAAPLIIRVLTQQRFAEFSEAVTILRLLSLAMFLAYFNHLVGYTIVALGRQRPYFFVALGALLFNLTANWLLIPRFSFYGAATVTILTEALVLIITSFFIFKILKFVPSLTSFPRTAWQLIKKKGKYFS